MLIYSVIIGRRELFLPCSPVDQQELQLNLLQVRKKTLFPLVLIKGIEVNYLFQHLNWSTQTTSNIVYFFILTDLTWVEDKILWVSSRNKVYIYDRTKNKREEVSHIHEATSVAYDWLGQKLYWSNPSYSMVGQVTLNQCGL